MTVDEVVRQIKATTFLRRFEFEAWPDPEWPSCVLFALLGEVSDSRDPMGHMVKVATGRHRLWPDTMTPDAVDYALLRECDAWLHHEAREWLRRDGRLLFDPHKEP